MFLVPRHHRLTWVEKSGHESVNCQPKLTSKDIFNSARHASPSTIIRIEAQVRQSHRRKTTQLNQYFQKRRAGR